MAFTFVHTADWQIGKAFGRFEPDVAARLRAARLEAIDRIAEVARSLGAAHVLVAGDVIDSELVDDAGLRQPLARMSAYPDIAWHLLPGNHDPARPGGVWERLAGLGLPENVHAHLRPEPCALAPGVVLLPAPLHAKEMRSDPTQWMDAAATAEGALRIGLAHGSVRGFGSLGEAAVPIDAQRVTRARLDYLALGDWHGVKEIAAGAWYAGTPEPDSFADNGPGHVLAVLLAGRGAPAEVTPIATGTYRWLERRIVLSRLADIEPVETEMAAIGAARRNHILALGLEGAIAAGEATALEARLERLQSMVLAVELDRRRLRVMVRDDDVAALGDPVLAAVGARLRERARDSATAEERVAARAMRLLLAYEAMRGEEGQQP
jgi:DNA repair exonuclease SbcCD nuclease subunit